MPRPGMLWRHFIINTLRTWLHGDPRGFRSRRHRIHSSGDYRNPPPEGEHEGLHRYHDDRSGDEVVIPYALRKAVGMAIVAYLISQGYRVLAVAVAKVHAHGLVELPSGLTAVKQIIGEAKRHSSRAVTEQMPGHLWAAGGTFKIVGGADHQAGAFDYVLYEQGPGAWTWSFRDGSREGCYGRKRPGPKSRRNRR